MKAGDVEFSENAGAICVGCCVGELCGELLAREDRSEPEIDSCCNRLR